MSDLKTYLEDKSVAFLDALEKRAQRLMKKMGNEAVSEMKEACPASEEIRLRYRGKDLEGADAQHLRDTIVARIGRDKGLELRLNVGATKFTGHFVVLGTETQPKRDFITPAMKRVESAWERRLIEEGNKIKL